MGDGIKLTAMEGNIIDIQYNGHSIADTSTVYIHKRCLVCNETYLNIKDETSGGVFNDLDKTVNKFFNEVVEEEELPFQ